MKSLALFALLALGGAAAGSSRGIPGGGWGPLSPAPQRTDAPLAPGWLSFDDIVRLGMSVGFQADDAYKMARIAWRESRGNPKAAAIVTRPRPGNLPERSFGLWQVNTLANPQYDEQSLLDPMYNAQAAFDLSHGGTNLAPWRVR